MSESVRLLVGNSFAALLRFVALWHVARTLGAETQGALSVAFAMLSFAGSILSGGLDYAAAWAAGQRAASATKLLLAASIIVVVSLLAAPLWLAAFINFVPAISPSRMLSPWSAVMLILLIPSSVAVLVVQGILLGLQRFRSIALGSILAASGWLVLLFIPAIRDAGYFGVLLSLLLSTGAQLVYLTAIVFSIVPATSHATQSASTLRGTLSLLLGYGARTLPGTFARALNLRLGLYASATLLSPTDVGVYALVLSIGDAYLQVPTAFGQVLLGRTAALGSVRESHSAIFKMLVAIGALCAIAAAIFGPELLRFTFGREYSPSRVVLVAIALAVTAHSLALVQAHALFGAGRPGAVSRAQWIALLVHGVAIVLLGRPLGMTGLAFGMLVAFTVYAAVLLRVPWERSVSATP